MSKGGGGGLIFFANLPHNVDSRQLKEHCRSHIVHLRRVETFDSHKFGRPARLAVAELVDDMELQTAISVLNNSILSGRNMIVRENRRNVIGDKTEGKGYAPRCSSDSPGETREQLDCFERDTDNHRSNHTSSDSFCCDLGGGDIGSGKRGSRSRGSGRSGGGRSHQVGGDHCGGDSDRGRLQDTQRWAQHTCQGNPRTVRSRSPVKGDRGGQSEVEGWDGLQGDSGKGGFRPCRFRPCGMPVRQLPSQPLQPQASREIYREDLEAPELRRLYAENLAIGVDWKALKDLLTRIDAVEACSHFNRALLQDAPIRLRQDQGQFDCLRACPPPLQFWSPCPPPLQFRRPGCLAVGKAEKEIDEVSTRSTAAYLH